MKIKFNEFLAIVYADLFDYPLKQCETKRWSIDDKFHKFATNLNKYERFLASKEDYLFLRGRAKLVNLRKQREKNAAGKAENLTKVLKIIKNIPTVEGLFLTGSVAVGNAKDDADIDVMIITSPGTLWLTRLSVFLALKTFRLIRNDNVYKDKICPNIFLDEKQLEIKDKNLYTAHEILQVKCVFDRGGVEERWLKANEWVEEYLGEAYRDQRTQPNKSHKQFERASGLILKFLDFLEWTAFRLQYQYMRKKISNEKIGRSYAFFHPNDLSTKIEKRFRQRLLELGVK